MRKNFLTSFSVSLLFLLGAFLSGAGVTAVASPSSVCPQYDGKNVISDIQVNPKNWNPAWSPLSVKFCITHPYPYDVYNVFLFGPTNEMIFARTDLLPSDFNNGWFAMNWPSDVAYFPDYKDGTYTLEVNRADNKTSLILESHQATFTVTH